MKGTSITLQPHEGFLVPDEYKEIPLYQAIINKNNYGYHGHDENLVFKIEKTLLPFAHGNKKDDVVINLELITLSDKYLLYLEEPPLFRDKDNRADPYKHAAPMIFSYQHNQYGNQYGNIYDAIYGNHGDQYGHNYGNQYNDYGAQYNHYMNQYLYNNYGNQYQPNLNQYGHNYGYNPYGHGYQHHQQYHHNYGGGGYNAYGHRYQLNPNQYGHNYGGGYY